jgi:(4S)-4-hydroxy-5-phosphonooxypentane-2,3-dione isomerase
MFVVQVSIEARADQRAAFIAATLADAGESRRDPGVLGWAVLQSIEGPNRFLLHEVYASREDGLHHLETAHFKAWRAAIASMIVAPPVATTYASAQEL